MATRTVSVALVADVGNYVSAMTRASASTSAVGRNAEQSGRQVSRGFDLAGKGGLLLAAGAAGAALGLKSAIGAASDLNETLNKSNVIFGDNAGKIERWSQNAARDFGLSKAAALEAAASFGNMFQQLGYTGDAAAKASTDTVKLAADLGSFNNLETGDVLERIQAALRGEYDSLQLLIPNINAARVESEAMATTGKENAKQLTAQEKAAAVLAIVNRDGAAAANDFAETSSGLANSTKIAKAEFDDLTAQIGQAFLPAAQAAMGFVGHTAIPALSGLFGIVQDVSGAIADNSEVALALAAVLAVQLAGGVSAVTIAFNRMILTPVVLGLSSVLGVALNLPAAFAAARTAVAGFIAAAAPLVAVGAIVYGIAKTVEFATAAGDASKEVAGMWDAVDDSRGGEQLSALAGVVDQLHVKIRSLKEDLPDNPQGFLGPLFGLEFGGDLEALDRYEKALEDANEQQRLVERTAAVMGDRFNLTRDQVLDLASKYNIDLTGGLNNTFRLFQNFYGAEFGAKPTEATIELSGAMDDAKKAIDDAKNSVDAFKLSLDILTGAHVSMIEVESAFEAAVASADGALADLNGSVLNAAGGLNMQSESGRAAADVLLDVRDSGNQLIATLIQQGGTADEVRAKDAQLRESFIRSAIQMGISETAALALADQILGIPSERETRIDADTKAAQDKIAGVQSSIDGLHGRTVEVQVRAAGRFIVNPQGGLQEFAEGGWTGPGSKYKPAGIVHADEFVVPKARVNALGGPGAVGTLVGMPGYANGGPVLPVGYVHDTRSIEATMEQVANAMRNATPKAGVAGTGAVGGAWGSLWQLVKSQIPAARINDTFRAGDPGYHGRGKAIDFGYGSGPGGAGSAGLAAINRLLHDQVGKNLAELIYDGIGDDRPDLKNGRPLTYSAATRAQHHNHVHAAVYDQGGPLYPGYTLAYNGTGKTEWVSKESSGAGGPGGGGGGVAIDYARLAAALDSRASQVTIQTSDNPRAIVRALRAEEQQRAALAPAW